MESQLVERLRAAAAEALAPQPVRFAYLFGSQATGRALPDSDVDIAVMIEEGCADEQRVAWRCADALAAASQIGRIEVTVLNHAPIRFAGRVLRDRIALYSRDESGRVAYESLTGRMADDIEIWAAPMDRELLAAIAEGRR